MGLVLVRAVRARFVAKLLLVVLAFGATAAAAQTVSRVETMRVGSEERSYLIELPPQAGPPAPRPTIIALHAAGQTSDGLRDYLGMQPAAEREGYVTVYPQGIGRVWNDGRPAAMRLKAVLTPGDDVPFLVALAQRLVQQGVADPSRLYLMGISNGGFMVERMACEYSGLFAAYAVAMATAPANYREECQPSQPVPIMFVHGTADGVINWNGFWTPLGATLSAPDSAELYARLDECTQSSNANLPDIEPLDATTVSVRRWTGCAGGAEVALYRIERGGHQSPARTETKPGLATPFLGLRNRDIDMGEEAIAFFDRYPIAPVPAVGSAPAGASVPLPVPSPVKAVQRRAERPAVKPQGVSLQ